MAKTIIQTIGPLYGEPVNGTVFGRPNGSIYVPIANTIAITAPPMKYVRKFIVVQGQYYALCNASGVVNWGNTAKAVAESQDMQNYIQFELSATSDFETVFARIMSAGQFNVAQTYVSGPYQDDIPDIVQGATYYLRAVLMSANGVPVATSEVIEITGVADE